MTSKEAFRRDGFVRFAVPGLDEWLAAARRLTMEAMTGVADDHPQWRCGGTWFVGLDLLPNDGAGDLPGAVLPPDLPRRVEEYSGYGLPLSAAQVSIVRPGYPVDDGSEAPAAARFRRNRAGAHVDGVKPRGPEKSRRVEEFHAFVLGLPLDPVKEGNAPLAVWKGSHRIMGPALAAAGAGEGADVTEAYKAARKSVFETRARVHLTGEPGDAWLLHRHLLHGVAPWDGPAGADRRVAYFRPELPDAAAWLAA